jgi:hypothetical protein
MNKHVLIAALQQKDQQIKDLEEEVLILEVAAEIDRLELAAAKRSKRIRSNDRTEVMALARRSASDPNDPRSVLEALKRMAPYSPLCGYDSAERVFRWDTGNEDAPPKFQTEKDALALIRRHIAKHQGNPVIK